MILKKEKTNNEVDYLSDRILHVIAAVVCSIEALVS